MDAIIRALEIDMPFTGEHACRIRSPREFVRFRRNNEVDPNIIIGFRKDNSSDVQSFRYPIAKWTEARARKHCVGKEGRFEAAIKKKDGGSKAAIGHGCDDVFEVAVAPTADAGKCAELLMGLWLVEPTAFTTRFDAVRTYGIPVIVQKEHDPEEDKKRREEEEKRRRAAFKAVGNVGVLRVSGMIVKRTTSFASIFDETSSIEMRQAIRTALADPDIESMVLMIDSPGGTVAGTHALLEELKKARAAMPVIAHIDDMGASAAWFIAAQAHKIVVSKTAIVGSLGTFAHVIDTSGKAKMEGIRHHIIKAGEHKGDMAAGMPITESALAETQKMIDDLNEQFMIISAEGRGMSLKEIKKLADGRVHIGMKAVEVGLADSVGDLEAAIKLAKETAMTDQEKAAAFEAENPETVQKWRTDAATAAVEEAGSASYDKGLEEGKATGADENEVAEHARLQAIIKALGPGRAALAIDQFIAGSDAVQAKAALADTLAEENKDLLKQVESATDGGDAVAFIPDVPAGEGDADDGDAGDGEPKNEFKAKAEAEWSKMDDAGRSRFSSRERYINVRTAELDGRMQVSSSTRGQG